MSGNDKDFMGYDPLEWLKGDDVGDSNPPPVAEIARSDDTPQPAVNGAGDGTDQAPVTPVAHEADAAPTTPVLELGHSLQIMDVALLKPRLEAALGELKEITLRADEGIVVDGAGMQLLLAFVAQAANDGVTLQWEATPAPIIEAARLLNTPQLLLRD